MIADASHRGTCVQLARARAETASSRMGCSLLEVARAQAEINARLRAGNAFGEIGEWVAAEITGTVRFRGAGHDLMKASAPGWSRPAAPAGLDAPGPVRMPYLIAAKAWRPRIFARYQAWLAQPGQLGEVKARQVDRRLDPVDQLVDTRRAGPDTPFFPFVDFYVLILFGLDGDILMARHLLLDEMVRYVATDVGRGGTWNYKIAIGAGMTAGADLTGAARAALRYLAAG